MRKFVAVLFLLLGSLSGAASVFAVTHYTSSVSSVDGSEIAWGGSTTYNSQWTSAIATWNARGKINITPDTVYTIEDLTVSDVNSSTGAWTATTSLWTHYGGADTIQLNKYYLSGVSSSKKQNTCTHELGHALGLAHSPMSTNVMYRAQTSQTSLGAQDISDYSYLYP